MMASCKLLPILTAFIALSLAGCSSNTQTNQSSFEHYLSTAGLSSLSAEEKAEEKIRFENQQRLLSYIEASDLVDLQAVDAKLASIRSDMLMSQFFEKRYEQAINENTIAEYYEAHQSEFSIEQHHLAHILLKVPASANQQERDVAQTTAQEILARLHTGESFGELANIYSEDQKTAANGGDLGWAGPGSLTEALRKASAGIDAGDTPIIVEAAYGLHIVKKIEESREQALSLSQVRPRIIKALRASVKAAEMQRVATHSKS